MNRLKNSRILTDLAKTNYLMFRYNYIDIKAFEQVRFDPAKPIITNIPN